MSRPPHTHTHVFAIKVKQTAAVSEQEIQCGSVSSVTRSGPSRFSSSDQTPLQICVGIQCVFTTSDIWITITDTDGRLSTGAVGRPPLSDQSEAGTRWYQLSSMEPLRAGQSSRYRVLSSVETLKKGESRRGKGATVMGAHAV